MEIYTLKGSNGVLKVYEDRVSISRNTINGLIYQGIKGDKIFFYNNLSSIEYKAPTFLTNGYIKFIVAGTVEKNQKAGLFGISTSKSLKDANTLILVYNSVKTTDKANEIYEYMLKQINKYANGNVVQNNISSADEIMKFKKLLDDGVITQEEFDVKKKELLGL